jgi:LysM repeat protein
MAEERKVRARDFMARPKSNTARRTAFAIADQFMPATAVKRLIQGRGGKAELKTLANYASMGVIAPLAFGASKDAGRAGKQLARGDYKRGLGNLGMAALAVTPGAGKGIGVAAKGAKIAKTVAKGSKVGRKAGKKPKGRPTPPQGYPTKSAGMNPGRARKSGPEPEPRRIKSDDEMAKSADRFAKRRSKITQGKATDVKPTTQRGTVAQGTRRFRSKLDSRGRFDEGDDLGPITASDKKIDRLLKTTYQPRETAKDRIARETGELGPKPSKKSLSQVRKQFRATREFSDFRKRLRGNTRGGSRVRDTFVEGMARRAEARAREAARKTVAAASKGSKAASKSGKKTVATVSEQVRKDIGAARSARKAARGSTKPTPAQIQAFAESTKGLKKMAENVAKQTSKTAKGNTSRTRGKKFKRKPGQSLVLVPGKGRVLRETVGRRAKPSTGKELVPVTRGTKTESAGKELVKTRPGGMFRKELGVGYVPKGSVTEPSQRAKMAGKFMNAYQKRQLRKVLATGVTGAALAGIAQRQINKKNAVTDESAKPTATRDGGSRPKLPPIPKAKLGGRRGYTVQAGDSLSSIAKKHGVSLEELLAANKGRLTKNTPLFRGSLVRLPKKASDPKNIGVAGKKRSEGRKASGRVIRFRKTGVISVGSGKPRGRGKLR